MGLSSTHRVALTVALAVMAAMLCACSRPKGYCSFERKKTEAQHSYSFKVQALDTTATYRVSVICRYDARQYAMSSALCVLRCIAPDSTDTARAFLLRAVDADEAKRSGSVVDLSWTLQRRMAFPREGEWNIVLQVPNIELCKAAAGFGINIEME
jgi:hypothetical protein